MVLQLLGILTVAWGISETRALFGHPTFASKLNQWLARMPLLPRNVVIGVGSANLGMIGFNARGHTSYPIDPSANIPQRLSALEKNIQLIQDRITQTQAELDKGLSEAKGVLEKERLSREEEDCAIREKLEATGTGGVHISAIGAAWLFVGVILSTAAIELAGLIK